MKNINKNGFTLIELLAVVVILLAISVMAISSISAAMERNKAKQDDAKKEVIISYAKLYYDKHKNSINDGTCISLDILKTNLGLTDSEITDSNGNTFSGVVLVSSNGTKFEYIDDNVSCSEVR